MRIPRRTSECAVSKPDLRLILCQLNLCLRLQADQRNVEMANTQQVTMHYITPIMVVIGICSMNDDFIFFKSKISIPIITILVFAFFSFLQYIVPRCNGSPEWWKRIPQWLKNGLNQFSLVIRGIGRGIGAGMRTDRTVESGSLEAFVP